jgi:hypothetical protein
LKSELRSGSTPSSSEITVTGSGMKYSDTMSKSGLPSSAPSASRAIARTRASISLIFRGVKPRFTRFRIGPCTGGSAPISERPRIPAPSGIGILLTSSAMRVESAAESPVPAKPEVSPLAIAVIIMARREQLRMAQHVRDVGIA